MTEEFLNVGVVLYAPEAHYLQAIMNHHYGRLSHTFQKINGEFYRKAARGLESRINQINQQLQQGSLLDPLPTQLEQLLARILPPMTPLEKAVARIQQETDNVEVVEEKDASAFSERFATIIKEHQQPS